MTEIRTELGEKLILKGDADYETARCDAAWRANKPERHPAAIVLAETDADVVAAVQYAKARGLKVGVRSGGHSWTSPHIRDGALLIDLSRMTGAETDRDARRAWVRPGTRSRDLNAMLYAEGLVFPGGHCPSVGIGGFLMNGGWGWNARAWGNGCANVRAVDVVTADGELIRADATQNTDYYWAVRGSGAGFFGVVTRFLIEVYEWPKAVFASAYRFQIDELEALLGWARDIVADVPPYLELVINASSHDANGDWAPVTMVLSGMAFAETDEEAFAALALLETCPVIDKAEVLRRNQRTTIAERYPSSEASDPEGCRFTCDSIYIDAPSSELVPFMRELYTTMPSPRTHLFWLNWGPKHDWDDMALSVQGEIYLGAYAVWDDPADDTKMHAWVTDQMARMAPISRGAQLNDENMLGRNDRYLSEDAAARLESLRAKHDPEDRFHSFLTAEAAAAEAALR